MRDYGTISGAEEAVNRIDALFSERFSPATERIIVRSPGRVNLIGEHTDYNEGFVLPASTDRAILMAVGGRKDGRCRLHAMDLGEDYESALAPAVKSERLWPNYLMGVADQMAKAGYGLRGFDCAFGGDIPIGSGMSSSAAIEGGIAFALNRLFDLGIEPLDLVRIAQRAENEFVGVRCGIMDQFINIFGRANQVVRLDCRSLQYDYFPWEQKDLRIVLCDTGIRRKLASSEYNVRRRQCESGVAIIGRRRQNVRSLRDVSAELLAECRAELDPIVYKRCEYVIAENERVLSACDRLRSNDFNAFGKLMYASHAGLRDLYEVSCAELDVLVDLAAALNGVLGARMMGAGFGGCTINLVEEGSLEGFVESVRAGYHEKVGSDITIHTARIGEGTSALSNVGANISPYH